MKKKVISLVLIVCMFLGSVSYPKTVSAKTTTEMLADILYEEGLFLGTGMTERGEPIFQLSGSVTRAQAVTMLVRILGKESEALANKALYVTPFEDVPAWAVPYVGYAYENGLTGGTSATTFSPNTQIPANQFLTFCLRALGYSSETDFSYKDPFEFAQSVGFVTAMEYGEKTVFNRGDMVLLSCDALRCSYKNSKKTLGASLGIEQAVLSDIETALSTYTGVTIEKPSFYEANGLSYPSALGKPVLGESAAALVSSVSQSEASKQITNVGDAIWYMQSVGKFDDPSDACYLFASLIARDYDEVGFIMLRCPGNGYRLAYVLQDGIYYLLNPDALARGYSGWFCGHGRACTEGEDLDAICEEAMATWPDGGADQSKRSYSVEKRYARLAEQEEELFAYLTTPQYTGEQIDQWVAEGLTLEQWAEKIRVPADAIQMLEALGYSSMLYPTSSPFDGPNGTHWGADWNAKTVFEHRSGKCGGTSNLMNALLSGDFDEQGYVEYNSNYGGHVFNYFLSDGIYVMCDFVGLFAEERVYIDEGTDAYVIFVGGDLCKFEEEYMTIKGHNDPEDTEYILQLFMHPNEGANLPKGYDKNSSHSSFDSVVWDLLPQQYQDSYTILFEREGYPVRFVPISDPNTWPAEVRTETNAPADTGESSHFYTLNGLFFPSELGEPVLGEDAAALVSSVSLSAAAEQITNVGDAIWYLQSAEKFDQPYDACNLFATLIAGDYDEVGFIRLTCPGNGRYLAYVLQDGIYYLLDPFALARGYSGWFCGHGRACTEGEDLDAICEEVMETWPDGGADQSKRSYSIERRYFRITE